MILLLSAAMLGASSPEPGSAYDRGVSARRAGNSQLAIELLKQATSAEPANADAWVQYGFALRDAGRVSEARNAFREALRLAPEYRDAQEGLASLDRREPAGTVLSADLSSTAVKNSPDWLDLRFGASTNVGDRKTISAALEASRRFGRHDVYGEVRLDERVSRATSYYVLVGGTVAADYRPKWQIGAGGSQRLVGDKAPLLATFDGRVARYNDGTTWTLSPGFEQYLAGGKIWLSGKWINVFSHARHRSGAVGRIDVQANEVVRAFAGFGKAPDLSEGRVLNTTSLFGGAVIALNERIEWRISASREKPSNGLDRTTISSGLNLRLP